ncbi:MAG TPA: 50S ribosomal protein L17 [Flavobacteriales bacterium]|nr:50S ribosomal protein L17 [Flavobacteriales bacterium]|tara:strand:- start:17170 stop:17736 length:567 start_codon:yes stop_codon:yes gene_type:complete
MRHGKKFNHLGRKKGHREAMLSNMACSLIKHKRINTTVAKAKALRKYIEPLITKSKNDTTHNRRVVFSYLQDKHAVSELYRDIAPKVMDRPGGYTRILKTGFRLGDNAEMCFIELVDFNETYVKETKKKSTRRRRGGKKTKAAETTAATPATEETATEETPKAEAKENENTENKSTEENKNEEGKDKE